MHMIEQQMTTKKALLVLGFLITLIGISLVIPAKWLGVNPARNRNAPLILKSYDELAVLQKDTDRNNNPDWKDLLLETTSASTTRMASEYTVTEADKLRLADPNNITASFSKNLYTVSSYAKKKGDLTQAEQQNLVTELMNKESEKLVATRYTVYDIKAAPSETLASKKAYGNELGKVFKKATGFKLDIVDLDKIQAYSTSKDPSTLASLTIKKNDAKVIITELLKLSVPRSAVAYHLLIVNRLSQYVAILEGITSAETDPMRSAIAFNGYIPAIRALFGSLENMKLYFKLEEITFINSEPGYVLNSGYTTP